MMCVVPRGRTSGLARMVGYLERQRPALVYGQSESAAAYAHAEDVAFVGLPAFPSDCWGSM
jgi:hypothetical protein